MQDLKLNVECEGLAVMNEGLSGLEMQLDALAALAIGGDDGRSPSTVWKERFQRLLFRRECCGKKSYRGWKGEIADRNCGG